MARDEKLVHFAHEHPLTFSEVEEIRYCCNACGLRVLSSPYYFCTIQDCNFYLHRACTRLPHNLDHYHRNRGSYGTVGKHYLALLARPRDDNYRSYGTVGKHSLALLARPRDDNYRCGDCGKLCKNFTYHCSECEFALHLLCGSPSDIQIKHISHPQHPMIAMRKEALLLCDICGREHKGYFFSCHQCDFWIHQDCASIPSLVKVEKHGHHLSLFYSVSTFLRTYYFDECLFCRKPPVLRFGLYFCFNCHVVAHVDCAISHMKDSGVVLHLPTMLDDMIMRTGVKEMAIQESNSKDMLEKYHTHHSLVLIDGTAQGSICNACIRPISPPYYNCRSAQSGCNFLLHKLCADLPLSVKHPFYESSPGNLATPRWDVFFSPFRCYSCEKYNNGFGYSFSGMYVDIDCALAPMVITHDSHKQHPLTLINSGFHDAYTSCCRKENAYTYHCSVCKVSIHIDCARMLGSATHEFDKHPLTLTFPSSSQHNSFGTDHFCEFCEEDIDRNYWFYHCAQCENSFHVNCIPSTGKYSRIKFGGSCTIKVPGHSDHPLTLVRTMSVCSQTCGYCDKIIKGFKDGLALHCAYCDYWIHLNCGYKCCDAIDQPPYTLKPFFYNRSHFHVNFNSSISI